MKRKIIFLSLVLLLFLSGAYAQKLDISIEYDSSSSSFPHILYWVNNNTGEDISSVEYILNGSYFYTSNLPVGGDYLDLFEFAKLDGTRYNYFSIKPIELKVKSKKGIFSVKFDDIPDKKYTPFPVSEEFREKREPLLYSQVIDAITVHTIDSVPVTVQVAFGYASDDKATPQEISTRKIEITDFLRSYFQTKTTHELRQEEKIKIEIRDEINDNVLTRNRIKDVRFTKYEIVEP